MKKIIAALLIGAMLLCVTACSGDKKDSSGKGSSAVDLEKEFGIDFEAAGEQVLSDERADKETLKETKDEWLGGNMTFALAEDQKTYEDFKEHIGCHASTYTYNADDAERTFVWEADGDETAKLLAVFWETPKGWTLYSIGSTNLD